MRCFIYPNIIPPLSENGKTKYSFVHALYFNCFDTTDWKMFRQAATYNNHTDIEKYTDTDTSYIRKCIDDVTHTKTTITSANQKPWLTDDVRRLLRERNHAFRAVDETRLRTARANRSCGIRTAKQENTHKTTCYFIAEAHRACGRAFSLSHTINTCLRQQHLSAHGLNGFFVWFKAQNNTRPQKPNPSPH